MQNAYCPYEVAEQKYTIQLKQKIKRLSEQIGLAYNDQYVLKLTDEKEHALVVVGLNGKEVLKKKISQTSTPFRMISNSEAIVFEAGTKKFQILNIREQSIKSFDQENSSSERDSSYQLEYFNPTGEICLIEKDKKNKVLRIRYYKYERESPSLKEVFSYETKPDEWLENEAVHILNDKGQIGWCSSLKRQFRMQIFSQSKGVISLHANPFDLSRIFKEAQFKVLTFCQHSKNEYYIVVNPESRNPSSIEQEYSPILKVVTNQEGTEVDFFNFEKTPFISSTYFYSMTDCSKLGRYLVLRTYNQESTQKKSPVYYFDLDTHNLALQRDWICCSTSKTSICSYLTYTILDCEFASTNCDLLNITIKEVKRNKSLAFERLLIVLKQLQAVNRQKVFLLVFGAEKSGKTTTRHYLSGHKLVHEYNEELEFNDLKPEVNEDAQFEHHSEKSRLIWLSETERSVIIEIPEWYDQPEFFKTLNSILLQRLYQVCQQLHVIITIPQELMQDSYRTIQIFTEVFDILKGNKEEIADSLSVILTKIQDESSKDSFIERNEEIAQQNQDVSRYLQRIIDNDRIYLFENRDVQIKEGKELQERILANQHYKVSKDIKEQEIIQFWEDKQEVKVLIQAECLEELQYFNNCLLYFAYLVSGLPERFNLSYLNSKISSATRKYSLPDGTIKDGKLALAYFSALAQFKTSANNQDNSEFISKLIPLFEKVENQLTRLSLKDESNLLMEGLSAFASVISLALKMDLNNDQEKPLDDVIKVFKDEENGIFGSFFSTFLKKLEEMYKQIQNSKELKEIRSVLAPATIIKRQVPMTYDEERQYYLKKKENRVDLINRLPCNAMKLDFMIEQLKPFTSVETVPDKDIRWVNTLLRQASKVCQYHDLFYESIVFLMIIPDFIGINLLLDDLIAKCRKYNTYDGKKSKLLTSDQSDVIDQLIILGREHLREGLLKKLIYIRSLDNESGGVKTLSIRKDEKLNLSTDSLIESYEKRLNTETEIVFYNFKKYSCFKKMIESKEKIITQCREFESQNPHKKHYEDLEALHWLIETLPIPSV